jgi:hypothetical protein
MVKDRPAVEKLRSEHAIPAMEIAAQFLKPADRAPFGSSVKFCGDFGDGNQTVLLRGQPDIK